MDEREFENEVNQNQEEDTAIDTGKAAEITEAAAAIEESKETPEAPVDLDATQGIEEAKITEETAAPAWHVDGYSEDAPAEPEPAPEPEQNVQPEEPQDLYEPPKEDYYRSAETEYEKRQEEYREQYQHKYDQNYDADYAQEAYQRAAAARQPGYVTKGFFIMILALAMVLTSLLSIAVGAAYTTYSNNKNAGNGHATNYTLSTSDESLSFKSIIQKTQDSVVSITTESVSNDMWLQNYVTQGAGSGVIIESDGYIITCEHVISGARKITVTLRDGTEYQAKIIGADAGNDIAVIKIDAKNLQEAAYGDSGKLEVGDQVVAIGNPLGTLSGTATTGIVSALNRNLQIDNRTLNLLQTDASINPGNSGGGLFDASGNLIGIVEAKSTGSDIDGLGFATPINKAAKIAKDIIEKGGDVNEGSQSSSQRVMIGIMVSPVDNATAQQFGYTHGGLLVKSVNSEEAISAGLRQDDSIYAADGKSVSNNSDLAKILETKKAGDKVKLSVARSDGSDKTITTKLISASN